MKIILLIATLTLFLLAACQQPVEEPDLDTQVPADTPPIPPATGADEVEQISEELDTSGLDEIESDLDLILE